MSGRPGRLIITIDGPAGTGKSSVGRELARRLGLEFLDTGAMYRAATAIVIDEGISPGDERAVADAVREAGMRFDWTTDPPTLVVGDHALTSRLRDEDIAGLISRLAAQAPLRETLVARQREIGDMHPRLVSEGRDQGSIVFPDADVKFYLSASARVRAQRRAAQLRAAGHDPDVSRIERELIERDRADSTRALAPLVKPADAVELDTSDMPFDAVLDELERIVRARVGPSLTGCGARDRGGSA